MNRRGFLAGIGALFGAQAAPKRAVAAPLVLESVGGSWTHATAPEIVGNIKLAMDHFQAQAFEPTHLVVSSERLQWMNDAINEVRLAG